MYWILTVVLDPNPQPDLNGNPFLCDASSIYTGIVYKKDWEWKADKAAIIFTVFNIYDTKRLQPRMSEWSILPNT